MASTRSQTFSLRKMSKYIFEWSRRVGRIVHASAMYLAFDKNFKKCQVFWPLLNAWKSGLSRVRKLPILYFIFSRGTTLRTRERPSSTRSTQSVLSGYLRENNGKKERLIFGGKCQPASPPSTSIPSPCPLVWPARLGGIGALNSYLYLKPTA